MPASDAKRLLRYAARRPVGPEHLDLLAGLIACAALRANGARVDVADCVPRWPDDDAEIDYDPDRVRAQAEALARTLKGQADD